MPRLGLPRGEGPSGAGEAAKRGWRSFRRRGQVELGRAVFASNGTKVRRLKVTECWRTNDVQLLWIGETG